jgi:hypothetical protein
MRSLPVHTSIAAFATLPDRMRPPREAIDYLRQPPAPMRGPTASLVERVIRGQRMQPTQKEIDALRGLARWARTSEAEDKIKIEALGEGIDRAIAELSKRHDSVTEMLLVAIHQAMVPVYGNRWEIVDADLFDFVGRELVKRYGTNPGAPRHEKRKPFS